MFPRKTVSKSVHLLREHKLNIVLFEPTGRRLRLYSPAARRCSIAPPRSSREDDIRASAATAVRRARRGFLPALRWPALCAAA